MSNYLEQSQKFGKKLTYVSLGDFSCNKTNVPSQYENNFEIVMEFSSKQSKQNDLHLLRQQLSAR